MNESTFRRYAILAQVVLTLIYFTINLLEFLLDYSVFQAAIYALIYTTMAATVVYLHYFFIFPIYFTGKRLKYFIAVILLMTGTSLVFNVIHEFFSFEDGAYVFDFVELLGAIFYDCLLMTIVVTYSSLYYFVEHWFKNSEKEAELRSEKLNAELNFLKSQINPHFLFNTLNNIYSYAQTNNQKTAPMLERLSSILRFMVYDCGDDRVEIGKEISAIESLLEIHKMKNSAQINVEFTVEGVKGFHLIAPLILVNFVENACKHSDVVHNKNGFIHIKLAINESDVCRLDISNTFREKTVVATKFEGFGLVNVRKRLELQYGDNFVFEERKDNGLYHMELEIPLERKK